MKGKATSLIEDCVFVILMQRKIIMLLILANHFTALACEIIQGKKFGMKFEVTVSMSANICSALLSNRSKATFLYLR